MKQEEPQNYKQLLTMETHNDIRKLIPDLWKNNQVNIVDRITKEWGLGAEYSQEEVHSICGVLEVLKLTDNRQLIDSFSF